MTISDIDKQLAEAITRREALYAEYGGMQIDDEVMATRVGYAEKRIDELLDERSKARQCV